MANAMDRLLAHCNGKIVHWGVEPLTSIGSSFTTGLIILSCVLGGLFTLYTRIKLGGIPLKDAGRDLYDAKVADEVVKITQKISNGANAFLFQMYRYMAVFVGVFAIIIILLLAITNPDGYWDEGIFSAIAFILGALTSIVSGFLGMRVAVFTNGRTAVTAAEGYAQGFSTAFRGGIVMGFGLSTLGLSMLFVGIALFTLYYNIHLPGFEGFLNTQKLFGAIAAYGLGGSSIAMFGRVGGGIFTKAADVGSDLVGKVVENLPEDDPRNPGVIADCIGDNVGDIAGMGSDLFGSFAEASCAALVIASTNTCLSGSWPAMMYPLCVSSVGMLVCIVTTFLATDISPAKSQKAIEPTLKYQLTVSTILATIGIFVLSYVCLPATFAMEFMNGYNYTVTYWGCFICVAGGLWAGLGIGYTTEYYTSNAYTPVEEVAESCKSGAATNVIYGLALGYKSVIVPTFLLATLIYFAYNLCSVYGIALGALGILSTMSVGLTIDAYGPISDNAGGIAEMAGMGEHVRERTDALDAAGNTTAAIGKGYAIGSAALVGLALYGAFLTRVFADVNAEKGVHSGVSVNIVDPRVYFGMIIGAMIPYWFSALTMKSVGLAARAMVEEIKHQFETIDGLREGKCDPNYNSCVQIATDASLREMIAPGALVVVTPIVFGIVFGPETLAGLLPGSLVSGVQMAISASNTGGAWDNAKKMVENSRLGEEHGKGSETHHAAVIGDTVGDPLKDTSGPALNIVVKLMAIISVVFAPAIRSGSSLSGVLFDRAFQPWAERDTVDLAAISDAHIFIK